MGLLTFGMPLAVLLSAVLAYRFNGRREFIKFDLVQFFYAFITFPVMFVWLKTFLFMMLQKELGLILSISHIFAIDTAFSVVVMLIYASVVIHSLTKSFELKRERDPLYDLFRDSEFFHMWFTHIAVFGGGVLILTVFSLINLWIPFDVLSTKEMMFSVVGLGIIFGPVCFATVYLSVISPKFEQLMKLLVAAAFILHALLFFWLDPQFRLAYGFYWFVFFLFAF